MKRSLFLSLRACAMALLICSLSLFPTPAFAAGDSIDDAVPAGVVGACTFQGATIEGVASATFGIASQTGIVCTVYDANGTLYGACGVALPTQVVACAGVTTLLVGPPIVCTDAWAVYPGRTATYHSCI